jgi:4'-phosphopantetheinyl transferase superfamily
VTPALAGTVLALPAGAPGVALRLLDHEHVRRSWAAALAQLTPAERVRAAGIAHPSRALAFVAGRCLMAAVREAGWDHASLTHGEGITVCAASPTLPLGVDVEPVTAAVISQEWPVGFSASEQQVIEALPVASRPAAFARAWTAKEAIYKLGGSGAVDDFSVTDPSRGTRATVVTWLAPLGPKQVLHAVALAWPASAPAIV